MEFLEKRVPFANGQRGQSNRATGTPPSELKGRSPREDNAGDNIRQRHCLRVNSTVSKSLGSKYKDDDESLSANVIMQLFSPIVTSQRVMATQFGNSYTSIHCKDGTNLVFDEYMGFLFTLISREKVHSMKRSLSVFISLVRHLCGPDVGVLRTDAASNDLLGDCLDNWHELRLREQSLLVEAVEQLAVNGDITTAALNALRSACASLKAALNYSRSHCLVFVQEKLLALYTSRESDDLIPSDLIFLNILASTHNSSAFPAESDINVDAVESSTSINNSPNQSVADTESSDNKLPLSSRIVFLKGKKGFRPHALHIVTISNGTHFIIIYQINSESLCSSLYDAFHHLTNFQKALECETDADLEKKAFESLESTFKRILDSLKKNKNSLKDVEGAVKTLTSRWDILKKKHAERVKSGDQSSGTVSMSANCCNLLSALRDVYQSICFCSCDLRQSEPTVTQIAGNVQTSLHAFSDFLTAKAFRNFTLRSRALLSINKYLEEFPGLVHFLYIDRVDHRLTAPSLDFSSEETNNLTKIKIWDMIEFSRRHLEDGHLAFMWKDTTFNYAYYLWFEDDQDVGNKYVHLDSLLKVQKLIMKIIKQRPPRYPSDQLYNEFGVMDIRQLYSLEIICRLHKNPESFQQRNHSHNTRNRNLLNMSVARKAIYQRLFNHLAPKLHNLLPAQIKSIENPRRFKTAAKNWIIPTGRHHL
ncbi:Hermansky-Pudlak syndrome 1 protein homolog [Nilaparvata lugens]|uniref:Hermansky-Pudlak syndrome 1 protein homolog n=1 Tax=Nilaparvata lugens TaxID=108931 RepID=UPI00193DB4ED|nr:Hermansky-Pudlak syndrome 1 protein homolog [Nilaparvata lugens]